MTEYTPSDIFVTASKAGYSISAADDLATLVRNARREERAEVLAQVREGLEALDSYARNNHGRIAPRSPEDVREDALAVVDRLANSSARDTNIKEAGA